MDSRQEFEKWYVQEYEINPNGLGLIHAERIHARGSQKAWQACQALNDAKIAEYEEIIGQQKEYLRGLNMCIGGEDSATTDNLTKCARYLDEEQCLFEVIAELEAKLTQAYTDLNNQSLKLRTATEALYEISEHGHAKYTGEVADTALEKIG